MSQQIIDQIKKMDVKSDEFFEIYKVVSDKYWTFEKPDMYQECGAALVKFAERAPEDEVMICGKVLIELFKMKQEKKTAAKMNIGFNDGVEYRIDIYQDGIEREKLEQMIEKSAKAMESGNFTVKGKKGQFGKDYFKKGKKK